MNYQHIVVFYDIVVIEGIWKMLPYQIKKEIYSLIVIIQKQFFSISFLKV